MTGLLLTLSVLVDQQGDILAGRSEAHGRFDPTVFPPFESAIWLLANATTGLLAAIMLGLVVLLIATRTAHR